MTFDPFDDTLVQMVTLPPSLTAKFHYLCKTRTANNVLQAKCSYLHEGAEYIGILFAPDNEDWFENLQEGALIKACRVSPCEDERYQGEYKGTALPLNQQSLDAFWTPVKTETVVIEMSRMPFILREAATMIEMLLAIADQKPVAIPTAIQQTAAPFRSCAQWEKVVTEIIVQNKRFHTQPFSTIAINAHIDANFNDFWQGDLVKQGYGKIRWKAQVTSAISNLLKCNFLERVSNKHYQITQDTFKHIFES